MPRVRGRERSIQPDALVAQVQRLVEQGHQEMTEELLELWDNPRLCPHFHLPLQSGSEAILHRMRRRYTPLQYADAVEAIRARIPDAAITADVIVGFPYSARPGTSAAHFTDTVEQRYKRERMDRILALAREQARLYRQGLLGTTRPVLWESSARVGRSTVWSGLADNYVRVAARSDEPLANRITNVTLEQLRGDVLWGSASPLRAYATPMEQPVSETG